MPSAANQKVWVCMTCAEAHFNPDQDYAACREENHQMYVGFVWPIEADQEKPEPTDMSGPSRHQGDER